MSDGKTVAKPDYYWHSNDGKAHPEFYNTNIDTYDLLVDGEYWATVQIPVRTPEEQIRKTILTTAAAKYPGFKRVEHKCVTYKLVASFEDKQRIRKVKAAPKVEELKPVRHVKVTPDVRKHEKETTVFVAIRKMDGYMELWESVRDYCYRFILRRGCLFKAIDDNHNKLEEGKKKISSYHSIARRYVFSLADSTRIGNLQRQLEKACMMSDDDVRKALEVERQKYADRRQAYYDKRKNY